jgi:hypothetical protein
MKNIIRLISVLIVSILLVSCFSKKGLVAPRTTILPLGDTIHINDGSLIYGLPMTVFNIDVDAERRIEKTGPYAKYAGDLLGIKDLITQDREIWSIKTIKVNSFAELDPSEFYVIESNTLFQTNVLSLKKAGLILDLNPDLYNSINGSISLTNPADLRNSYLDLGADEYFVNQSDTAFKLVKLDTAFIKIPYLVEKKKQLTVDQLAEKAAKAILEIRDGKQMILSGQSNVFPQDKSVIWEIDRLESQYLSLFAGKTWTENKKISYSFVPQKDMSGKPITLFRFSVQNGPSDVTGKAGIPVNIILSPVQKTKDISIIKKSGLATENAPKYDKLYYRIPDVVNMNIKMGEQSLYNSRKLVYQFGTILQMPANYIIGKQ